MAAESIGCSLAEAAESEPYTQYLEDAAAEPHPGLHVVYINTSLRTKALSHAQIPTITCTSSNVVQTVLQVSPFREHGRAAAVCAWQPLLTGREPCCSSVY